MRYVNSFDELEPEVKNRVLARTLELFLERMESKPHIQDDALLKVYGTNREILYKKFPHLKPENRQKRKVERSIF